MKEIDWTFGGLWPYEPKWFDTSDGKLHYIDEGPKDKPPVVFVHGNPEWSFLFRHDIAAVLNAGQRVIAVDHLGFGRSDKPGDAALYSIERHTERLSLVLDSLNLKDVTLVIHDWGGPIGLPWAVRHPDQVRGLCVLNSIGTRPDGPTPMPLPLRVLRSRGAGDVLVKGMGLFTKVFMFKAGVVHPEHFTPQIKQAYLAPHPNWSSRTGVMAFPRQIPLVPTDHQAQALGFIEDGLREHFITKPVQIIWAMKDISFQPAVLKKWQELFPHANTVVLENAGHFAEEDEPERCAEAVLACATGEVQ